MKNVLELTIDGNLVTLDVQADTSMSEDLTDDMDRIAPLIAWYGRCLAAAEHRASSLDTNYRVWRATVASTALSRDPKLAEHKIKVMTESAPHFLAHKQKIEEAEEAVTRLQNAVAALRVKADILRSRGAIARAEFGATGMYAKSEQGVDASGSRDTGGGGRGPSEKERREAVAEIMRNRDRGPKNNSRDGDDQEDG